MSVLRTVSQLRAAGLVGTDPGLDEVAQRYSVALTPAVQDALNPEDPADPVARQFVPTVDELVETAGERHDPIGDDAHTVLPGVVHRYPDRVLLKVTEQCPVYCRFCFRRETVGGNAGRPLDRRQVDDALAYIASQERIWEAILSGGDPLVLSTQRLRRWLDGLAAIPHLRIVRLHTRVPVVQPGRIDADLVAALRDAGPVPWVVLHANHAREFTPAARAACARLIDAGIPMRSQSVLLKGVNDSVEALAALFRTLVEQRITPYHLNQLDPAPGTGHFAVPLERGRALLRALRGRYSGLTQPTYVVDLPGGYGKSPIGPDYVEAGAEGMLVTDYQGRRHPYPQSPADPAARETD